MPKLTLHPLSVLAGAAVVGLVLLTSSQAPLLPTGFRIEYLPHPRDYVQIKEGTPYTVPAGKILVLTALGIASDSMARAYLKIDGQFAGMTWGTSTHGQGVLDLPPGLTAPSGSVVEVTDEFQPSQWGVAWGYLTSQ